MRMIRTQIDDFNSVGPGQKANLRLDVGGAGGGPTYSAIYVEIKHDPAAAPGTLMTQANMATLIESVNFVVSRQSGNGSRERIAILDNIGIVDYQTVLNYYGLPLISGYLPIFFRHPEFGVDEIAEDHFQLGTADVTSAVLEIKLASGIVSPELACYTEIRAGKSRNIGEVITLSSETYEAQAAAGTRQIRDLDLLGNRGLKALHISSGKIDRHEIVVNSVPVNEGPAALNDLWADLMAFNTGGRVPQSGYHHVDLAGNRYSDIWDMRSVNTFNLDLTFNDSESEFRVIKEQVQGVHSAPGRG
jgi:hypothetical protein